MSLYQKTTRDVRISVDPVYLEDQSEPKEHRYIWAYHVMIENKGRETIQLLTRHWRITDAAGNVHEVDGEGVLGEQPILGPGDFFEYTSGTPLATPSGFMDGTYHMESETGCSFDVVIPAFSLDSPHIRPVIQ
ncbi:MAG TPA: Co2+/Mg2+ efflux protein ApaG [Alphaproteobacteria bacterium]|nr:Co2+/Mg2+ efflux protein ApaG [Alphaproteobacteria bacterium]